VSCHFLCEDKETSELLKLGQTKLCYAPTERLKNDDLFLRCLSFSVVFMKTRSITSNRKHSKSMQQLKRTKTEEFCRSSTAFDYLIMISSGAFIKSVPPLSVFFFFRQFFSHPFFPPLSVKTSNLTLNTHQILVTYFVSTFAWYKTNLLGAQDSFSSLTMNIIECLT